MTPVSLRIDRTFKGVGRVAVFTGTTITAVRNRMSRMLTALHEEGRLDILRSIRDGEVTILEVYSAYQRKALHELAIGNTAKNLATSMKDWINSLRIPTDASQNHVDQLRTTQRYFEREKKNAAVADLPAILESLRNKLGVEHPRSFNYARAGALAFIRQTLKKSHPLWLAISAVEVRKVPKTEKKHPITQQVMKNLFPNPATDKIDAIAWGMFYTGMGAKEYWGKWEVFPERIHVYGTKRSGRDRDIPRIAPPAPPRMDRRTWEDKIRERTSIITPYDLRRSYSNLLVSARIPRARRKLYMGHGATDVTDLYEWHEVEAFLKDDGATIRAFLGLSPTVPHTIEIVKEKKA